MAILKDQTDGGESVAAIHHRLCDLRDHKCDLERNRTNRRKSNAHYIAAICVKRDLRLRSHPPLRPTATTRALETYSNRAGRNLRYLHSRLVLPTRLTRPRRNPPRVGFWYSTCRRPSICVEHGLLSYSAGTCLDAAGDGWSAAFAARGG